MSLDANTIQQLINGLQLANQQFLNKFMESNQRLVENILLEANPNMERKTTSIPNFHSFNRTTDRWSTYLLQLEQHFEAHGITDENTKRACILSWIGAENLELLQNLFDGKVKEKSFKDITSTLTKHFVENVHVLSARFKFYRTMMKSDQSYNDWVAELKGAAKDCLFKCVKQDCDESYTDSKIRDMIVIHTPHEKVRTAALQKVNPTLEEVLQIATVYESTVRTCTEIQEAEEASVNAINHGKYVYRQKAHQQQSTRNENNNNTALKSCPQCLIAHTREDCYHFKNHTKCKLCSKFGHIAAVCRSAGRRQQTHQSTRQTSNVHTVETDQQECFEDVSTVIEVIHSVEAEKDKIMVELNVNSTPAVFQVDTGATCTVIGLNGYRALGQPACLPTNKKLRAYGGINIPVRGVAEVNVQYGSFEEKLKVIVADCESATNILGLNWFHKLKFKVRPPNDVIINNCSFSSSGNTSSQSLVSSLNNLANDFSNIFKDELGYCKLVQANIVLKPNATPKFRKPYAIPFALFDDVRAEIDRLVSINVLKPINFSDWAAPIVAIRKPTGSIRLCADFKVGINQQIEIDRYPIPKIEDLFHRLKGGKFYSKFDLSEAYHQIPLSENSKKFLVINTPFGLYQYQRLPFGVASAPGIFQRFMEELVKGMTGCATYLDDIIVTGRTDEEHIANVRELFTRIEKYGLHCHYDKCIFAKSHVEYVGHIIDSAGIKPSEKRLEAIRMMPRPVNVREVESFIGKINYYHKFNENFSSKAIALNILRRQAVEFNWGPEQEQAFNTLKNDIIKATQLVHFNDEWPIILATDASQGGIGAVISHRYPDGQEKPIAFASKTLNTSQLNYSQVEKEALSIVFGVTRFHQFLYGRHFELVTDHQALTTIFNPHKKLPVMTMHRLQRWAIMLQSYDYSIRYRNTTQHMNADALSRLPVGNDPEFDKFEDSINEISTLNSISIENVPINAAVIAQYVKEDKPLSTVQHMIQNGWPSHLADTQQTLKPYFDRRFQLSCQDGVILLQTEYTRVVIPTSLQHTILEMLHEGHWGSSRMKQSARRYVWFPQIDNAIENLCKSCTVCQQAASQPKREYSSWPESTEPWQRLHLEFAGPFCGFMWIILVDAFSKFPYVVKTQSTYTETKIAVLQKIFAIEGLPQTIVSDNGTQLTSNSFKEFCDRNNIKHLTSAPFHPSSNGLAERFVRTFKESFSKMIKDCENKDTALLKYLVTFRATPNPTTGKSPAELLHGRQPRTLLSALKPTKHQPVAETPKYLPNQQVYVRKFSGRERWMRGKILRSCGRMMYVIACGQGNIRRHQNQVRLCTDATSQSQLDKGDWELDVSVRKKKQDDNEGDKEITAEKTESQIKQPGLVQPASEAAPSPNTGESQLPPVVLRRSERKRKPNARYAQ